MIGFVTCSALLVLIALGVMTRPIWTAALSRRRLSGALRLKALGRESKQVESLHRSGALDDEGYRRAKALIESRLLQALEGSAAAGVSAPHGQGRLAAALTLFVGSVVVAGYAVVGSPSGIDASPGAREGAGASAESPHGTTDEQMAAMVQRLADRLKDEPQNADGWAMLARSYVATGRHAEAVGAFETAVALRPDDAALHADFADALAMANGRRLEGSPLAMVERALKLDPAQPKALALAGTAAFDRGDYRAAVGYWERLMQADAPDGPMAEQMKPGLEEARRLAGLPAPAPADPPPRANEATAIGGRVTLAAEFARDVAPNDTLFIYARAQDGRRMPLSILRRQAKDLPLTFVLDDSLSMSPQAKLSSAREVTVEARVSKSGNAVPQAGDLVGDASNVAIGTRDLSIQINRKTP